MTATIRSLTIRFALRAAAAGKLGEGTLYFSSSNKLELDAVCLLVASADPDDDTQAIASERGFPQEGLDTETIEETASGARQFQDPPSDELLLESFEYYWRFDAWLPAPGAPDPPAWDEIKLKLDREFFDALGAERTDVPCRAEGCTRGAIHHSVFCRAHHFEAIKHESCPFPE
jgi:hypothetical protein